MRRLFAGVVLWAMAALPGLAALPSLGVQPVLGASATFQGPTAKASFGQSIVFEQRVDLRTSPDRVEVLIDFPAAIGPEVSEVPAPSGAGVQTLRFSLELADGHISPNTRLRARWRLTFGDATEVGPAVSVLYADTRFDWRTRVGDLVRIHWYEGDAAFGRRALNIAEAGVKKAEDTFGVTETEPIDFFVYASQAPFYDALGPGTRENVGGQAQADIRTMFALITPDQIDDAWVGTVLPHELTHLVFNTAVRNPYHFPPRWLNEGLAVYLSVGYGVDDRALVHGAAVDGAVMPLESLTGQFPTSRDRFFLAYSESVSAVDYLVRTYGRPALVKLVRSYADGVTDDEAFKSALGVDAEAFGAAWLKEVGADSPTRFGPQPAPAGPMPPGWIAEPSGAPGSAPPAVGSAPASQPAGEGGGATSSRPVVGIDGLLAAVLGAVALGIVVVGVALVLRSRRATP